MVLVKISGEEDKMIDLDTKNVTYYQVWAQHERIDSRLIGDSSRILSRVTDIKTTMTDDYKLTWDPKISDFDYFNEEALSFTDKKFAHKVLKKCGAKDYQLITKSYNIITQRDDITTFYIVKNYRNQVVADLDVIVSVDGKLDFKPEAQYISEYVVPLAFENKEFAEEVQMRLGGLYRVKEVNIKLFESNKTPLIQKK